MINIFKSGNRFPKLYLKEFPFHLNDRAKQRMQIVGQFLGTVLLTAFIAYIFLNNITPFGVTMHYNLGQEENNISELGPKNRVRTENQNGQKTFYQTHDLAYFSTNMPFIFDTATVKITYKNPDPNQIISLGFQDQEVWHYDTKPLEVPFLNNLPWSPDGKDPVLYQRE